jgi:hypothetical protein
MSKITEDLQIRGVEFEVIPHERTYTTIEEARALGISADEVLKTVVLHTKSGYALAVIPGARRLDMTLVRTATDDHDARLATRETGADPDAPEQRRSCWARREPAGALLPLEVSPRWWLPSRRAVHPGTLTRTHAR